MASDNSDRWSFLRRHAGIVAAIGAISSVGMSLSLSLPLLAIVMEQRGYSSSIIGINSTIGGVAALICTPFVPALARLVGAVWLLLWSVVLAAVIMPLFYVFDSLTVWFVLRFLLGLCVNTSFILSEFWINALAPAGKRGLVMGIYGTVLSVGFAVGPAILSLVGSEGFLPFGIGTALLALAVIPVLIGLLSDPPVAEGEARSFVHYLAVVPLATFAALAMGATESAIMTLSPVYGLRLGYSEHVAALLVTSVAIGNVVSQVPLGLLSDRMDRRVLLAAIALFGAVMAPLVMGLSSVLPALIVFMALCGGTAAGLYSVGLTHLGARLSGAELASANAAFLFMYSVGMLMGPVLTGAGMDGFGPPGFVAVPGLFLLAYGVFAVIRIVRTR